MLRIVLDSNVFISGNMWKGASYELLEAWKNGEIEVVVSIAIAEEVHDVLIRKFQRLKEDVDEFINFILSNASIIETKSRFDVIKDDPDDNKVLEAAVDSDTDYIVSGDRHLTDIGSFMGIKVVKPAEMVKIIRSVK